MLSGNTGRAVMKTSAVPVENQVIEAPAVVFESQHDVMPAFEAGLLTAIVSLLSVIRAKSERNARIT